MHDRTDAPDTGATATTHVTPMWATGPCPTWCERVHDDDDHLEDRAHSGEIDFVSLRMLKLAHGDQRLHELRVRLRQEWLGAEPQVQLFCDDVEPAIAVDLLLTEAYELHEVLGHALVQAQIGKAAR